MPLPYDTPLFWVLAIIGVILTGISKSGFAGGAGVVAVPLLALIIPVPQAAALVLPLLLVMDLKTIHYYYQNVHWHHLKALIPASMIGIAIGGFLMGTIPSSGLLLGLAVISILFSLWQNLAPLFGKIKGAGWWWGTLSGITSTLIHAGGPPVNIYLLAQQLPKLKWLATAGLFFGLMNVIKIIPYTLLGQWNRELLILSLLLIPAAGVGVWLGHIIQKHISEKLFMLICRALLGGTGCLLLLKALLQ